MKLDTRTIELTGELLAEGRSDELARSLAMYEPRMRRAVCAPFTSRARTIMRARAGSTVTSWLRDLREDYPGGHAQFVGAWAGRLSNRHWDAATVVLLGSKTAALAAKVWPIPEDDALARWVYPSFFPDGLTEIVERWSSDFAAAPKNWDRNRGRAVMYEWIENGLVEAPVGDGAVLMIVAGAPAAPGRPLLKWLLARPRVTADVFSRVFSTPGVRGASLAQVDQTEAGHPMRKIVVPGLLKAGMWTCDFVVRGAQSAVYSDLPAYQRRWFAQLSADLGVGIGTLTVTDGPASVLAMGVPQARPSRVRSDS